MKILHGDRATCCHSKIWTTSCYYFYVIWYLTTICVHGLNLVQFGISILVLSIFLSCYKCCDQGLNWFFRNLKDIKLCTNVFLIIILFITTHKTHWEFWIWDLIWKEKKFIFEFCELQSLACDSPFGVPWLWLESRVF